MLKLGKWWMTLAVASLALPALAGTPSPWNKPSSKAAQTSAAVVEPAAPKANVATSGFEYAGGDTGWQIAEHKYVLSDGRFVHSADCDHAVRSRPSLTPADIEAGRALYSGG